MSSRQVEEFGTLFAQGESLQLFQSAMDGGLRQCSIRGVAWRFFLGTLSGPPEGWRAALDRQQVDYDVLCARHCVDPSELADQVGDEVDLSVVNPLSVDEANPYAQYFASSALREQIDQDLFRLHPGNEFFARPEVRRVMRRILYVWASAHPELSYRQGMHELIAPLVSVIWHEAEEAEEGARQLQKEEEAKAKAKAKAAAKKLEEEARKRGMATGLGAKEAAAAEEAPPTPLSAAEEEALRVRTLLFELLTVQSVEAATWALFAQLMRAAREFFEPGTRLPPAIEPPTTPLLRKCAHIQTERLLLADPALHGRIAALAIEPQLYLLRWLRLLFGREFHVEDVKVVWDALFAFGFEEGEPPPDHDGAEDHATLSLPLVDDFAIAMLMYVRETVLGSDFNTVMKRLLKFPPVEEVHFLVQRALQLRRSYQLRTQAAMSHPQANSTPRRCAAAAAAASATATAASNSELDPWKGACSHLRNPPDWPPPPDPSSAAPPVQAAPSPAIAAAVVRPPAPFSKLAMSDEPPDEAAPPPATPKPVPAAPQAHPAAATPIAAARPPRPAAALDASTEGGARRLAAAERMGRSLQILSASLRPAGGAAVGFEVSSGAHAALLAALEELESVRRGLLKS